MKSFRKILVAVLVLTLSLCYLPLTQIIVSAAFGGGSGTRSDPYLINTVAHLKQLSDDVNSPTAPDSYYDKYFKLTSNINLSGVAWVPIGGAPRSGIANATPLVFQGHFDGDNKTISYLSTLDLSKQIYTGNGVQKNAGLFGKIASGATIANLNVHGTISYDYTNTTGSKNAAAGLLCAFADSDSTIINCNVVKMGDSLLSSVTLTSTASQPTGNGYAGGLIGEIGSSEVAVIGCSSSANVSVAAGEGSNVTCGGGLIGHMNSDVYSLVYKCYATGNVSTSGRYYANLGGFVGYKAGNSRILDCYAVGNVSSSAASLNTNMYVGGFAGYIVGGNISQCHSFGTASIAGSTTNYKGGFAGRLTNTAVITDNFYDQQKNTAPIGNPAYHANSNAPIGLNTTAFAQQVNFTNKNWDFVHNWRISGTSYPTLMATVAASVTTQVNEQIIALGGSPTTLMPTTAFSDGVLLENRNLVYYVIEDETIASMQDRFNQGYCVTGKQYGSTTLTMYSKITGGVIGKVKLTVAKQDQAALNINKLTDDAMTFGETWTMSTNGGSGTGAVTYKIINQLYDDGRGVINGNVLTITKAGKMTIIATKAEDATYASKDSDEYQFAIIRAEQQNFVINSDRYYRLGSGTYRLLTDGGNGDGAVTYQIVSGADKATLDGHELTITKAGTITVKAIKAGDDNYNEATSPNFEITAEKANQDGSLRIKSLNTHTFGSNYTIESEGGSGSGSVSYEIENDGGVGSLSGNVITITKAGNIKIKAIKAADDTYNEASTDWFTLTVNKANQAAVSINTSTSHTFGSAYQIGYTGGTTNGTVTYAKIGGSGEGTIDANGVLTITKAGTFVLQVTMAGNDNYNEVKSAGAGAGEFRLVVSKAEQTNDLRITSGTSHTFGSNYTITSAGGSGNGAVTYHIVSGSGEGTIDSNGVLTITKAGNFVIQVRKAGDDNYESSIGGTINLVVGKAAQTVSITSSSSHTFGSNYTITSTGGPVTTSISYSVENGGSGVGVINGDVLSITKAGNIKIKAVKAGNDNYNSAETIFELNVGKADRTIAINSASNWSMGVPYTITSTSVGGGAVTYSIVSGGSGAGQISNNILTTTKMGTVILKASQAADDNYNAAESANFTLTITIAADGVIITDLGHSGWNINAVYDAGTSVGSTVTGKIFLAAYDTNGKLFKVSDMKALQAGAGVTATFTNFVNGLNPNYKVKAFVWTDIDSVIKPLGNSFDIIL